MVSGKCYSVIELFLLCLFFQKYIPMSAADNCLNPTFKKDEKLVIDYYFNIEVSDAAISPNLCPIIDASGGQFSIVKHICSGPVNKETCLKNLPCIENRKYACYTKLIKDFANKCMKYLPPLDTAVADCVCAGAADDILTSNEALRVKNGVATVPALVLNGKYDPCFVDYSTNSIGMYICLAYKNQLPFC